MAINEESRNLYRPNCLTPDRADTVSASSLVFNARAPRTMSLFPVVGRQRHSPNVVWLNKFDPAVQRIPRIDIDYRAAARLSVK